MKRPRPVSSAASSTRSIDCPTHGGAGSADRHIAVVAACAIPEYPPDALFDALRELYSGQAVRAAIPAALTTYQIPSHLIALVPAQHQLARRETLRNSRGLTPAWLRKNRVKCAGSGKAELRR